MKFAVTIRQLTSRFTKRGDVDCCQWVSASSFIGFTGTPIEKTDANTRAVFGDYISIYDIHRAFEALSHKVVDLQFCGQIIPKK